MAGPPPAVAAVRVAVRRALHRHDLVGSGVLVACSGGADSLALAAAAAFVVPRGGGRAGAVVVDHGLQSGSDQVAVRAAEQCRELGLEDVEVVTVEVAAGPGGPEDAARRARLAALCSTAGRRGAEAVLLGHTQDDQAEQVLLGLARGSGARSLSGMPSARLHGRPPVLLLRPLLGLSRRTTAQACAELGITPWADPHNSTSRYARVRARALLPVLEADLGPGVVAALARTADLLRADADALDEVSGAAYLELGPMPWPVAALRPRPRAIRMRLWQRAAADHAVPPGALRAGHLAAVDDLVRHWHGQGPVDLPGGVRARRALERVWLQGGQLTQLAPGSRY